jgi:hypothetical protein
MAEDCSILTKERSDDIVGDGWWIERFAQILNEWIWALAEMRLLFSESNSFNHVQSQFLVESENKFIISFAK